MALQAVGRATSEDRRKDLWASGRDDHVDPRPGPDEVNEPPYRSQAEWISSGYDDEIFTGGGHAMAPGGYPARGGSRILPPRTGGSASCS
jgi:hypothetical protein